MAWEDRNPRKVYASLKQYSGKMKKCSPVLNIASGKAVGEGTFPNWRDHFKNLLNRSLSDSSWKRPPGGRRKFWTQVMKEDLKILGVGGQFGRDARLRRIWNSDEWIDSEQALAADREGWAELCSKATHLGEAGNRVRR
ncbi:hypothetical protein RB195_002676 [Necator americanus]|uniref:Uncharacterized protein n=1 Tax=Necator americanus TaxID=51031 RepID=A0ABR1DKC5_NECAM